MSDPERYKFGSDFTIFDACVELRIALSGAGAAIDMSRAVELVEWLEHRDRTWLDISVPADGFDSAVRDAVQITIRTVRRALLGTDGDHWFGSWLPRKK